MVSFPRVSPLKPCKHLSSPPIRATFSAHLILLDLITRRTLGEQYRSYSSLLRTFLHSLLDPNIYLSTLFSNALSLRSLLRVSDQVSHPHKTTGKFIVLYILTNSCGYHTYWQEDAVNFTTSLVVV